MSRTVWNDSLILGVAKLDRQHRRIFELLGALLDACATGRPQQEVDDAVAEAHDYIDFHCTTEQRLMEEHEYPGIAEHMDEHDDYLVQASDALPAASLGGELPTADVLDYLIDWWPAHIQGPDRELAAFLKERGVK